MVLSSFYSLVLIIFLPLFWAESDKFTEEFISKAMYSSKICKWDFSESNEQQYDRNNFECTHKDSSEIDWKLMRDSLDCQRKYQSIVKRPKVGEKTKHNFKSTEFKPTATRGTSVIKTSRKETSAQAAIWSHCYFCSTRSGKVLLHDPEGALHASNPELLPQGTPIHLARSQHLVAESSVDVDIFGEVVPIPFDLERCDLIVDKPVFVFVLAWQVGHLIVDGLEGLFDTMLAHFGEVNTDVYLFLDAVGSGIRTAYAQKLMEGTTRDSPFSLLRNFTQHPLYTYGALSNFPGEICFSKGLFLGLNISYSYYAHGYDFHPSLSSMARQEDRIVSEKYKLFRRFILNSLGLDAEKFSCQGPQNPQTCNSIDDPIIITYVKRMGNRFIENESEMLRILRESALGQVSAQEFQLQIVQLEQMDFSMQIHTFQRTSILVSQWGTAAHNVLFMRPGSILVLLVHPGFCNWVWAYANQAVFSDVHVYVLCDEPGPSDIFHFAWTKKPQFAFPWATTDDNHTVDLRSFSRLITASVILASWGGSDEAKVEQLLYKAYPPQESILPRIDCGRAKNDFDAWAHLGPVVSTKTHVNQVMTMKITVSIFSTLHPTSLLDQVPALAPCASLDMKKTELCLTDALSGTSRSYINVRIEDGTPRLMSAWLRDMSTGQDLPNSETYLWIHPYKDYHSPIASNNISGKFWMLATNVTVDGGRVLQFKTLMGEKGALQRSMSCFCRAHYDKDGSCVSSVAMAAYEQQKEQSLLLQSSLPLQQHIPHTKNPFVLLQLQQTGTISFLSLIATAARELGLNGSVSCFNQDLEFDPNQCSKSSLIDLSASQVQNLQILAGDFQWNVWSGLPDVKTNDVSCLVLLRHPISRAISYYYRFIYPSTKVPMNEVDNSTMYFLLEEKHIALKEEYIDKSGVQWSHPIAEGISNAACKMMCGAHVQSGVEFSSSSTRTLAYDISIAKAHLDTCTVGIMEYWPQTKDILALWFPWISPDINHPGNEFKAHENVASLDPNLKQMIRDSNSCDLELFHYGLQRFRQQLMYANERRNSKKR